MRMLSARHRIKTGEKVWLAFQLQLTPSFRRSRRLQTQPQLFCSLRLETAERVALLKISSLGSDSQLILHKTLASVDNEIPSVAGTSDA